MIRGRRDRTARVGSTEVLRFHQSAGSRVDDEVAFAGCLTPVGPEDDACVERGHRAEDQRRAFICPRAVARAIGDAAGEPEQRVGLWRQPTLDGRLQAVLQSHDDRRLQ